MAMLMMSRSRRTNERRNDQPPTVCGWHRSDCSGWWWWSEMDQEMRGANWSHLMDTYSSLSQMCTLSVDEIAAGWRDGKGCKIRFASRTSSWLSGSGRDEDWNVWMHRSTDPQGRKIIKRPDMHGYAVEEEDDDYYYMWWGCACGPVLVVLVVDVLRQSGMPCNRYIEILLVKMIIHAQGHNEQGGCGGEGVDGRWRRRTVKECGHEGDWMETTRVQCNDDEDDEMRTICEHAYPQMTRTTRMLDNMTRAISIIQSKLRN